MKPTNISESGKVKNNSGDKKYFIITPRIVWALARNTYDFTLWCVIKDIAGEEGECDLTTEELAILGMMSIGKAHDSREYLISVGLLHGELERSMQTSNRRWTLVVPDLWESNIKLSSKLLKLKDRVKYKQNQTIELKKPHSPGEPDSHSPGEGPHSPGERPPSPHEFPPYKKNQRRFFEEGKNDPLPKKPILKASDVFDSTRHCNTQGAELYHAFMAAAQKIYAESYGVPFQPLYGDKEQAALRFFSNTKNDLELVLHAYRLFLNSTGHREPGYYAKWKHALWLFTGETGDGQHWIIKAVDERRRHDRELRAQEREQGLPSKVEITPEDEKMFEEVRTELRKIKESGNV